VLSQCNTIFALRISHQSDQQHVRSALSESATGLFEFLASLRNAEAIAIGEGVAVQRIRFDDLPEDVRPISGTARFSTAWAQEVKNTDLLGAVVERRRTWRRYSWSVEHRH
jgi:DNA helicase HerA-like ATPase